MIIGIEEEFVVCFYVHIIRKKALCLKYVQRRDFFLSYLKNVQFLNCGRLTLLEGTDFLGIVSIAFFLASVYFLTSVDLFSL